MEFIMKTYWSMVLQRNKNISFALTNPHFRKSKSVIARVYINRVSYIKPQFTFINGEHFKEQHKVCKNTRKRNKYSNKKKKTHWLLPHDSPTTNIKYLLDFNFISLSIRQEFYIRISVADVVQHWSENMTRNPKCSHVHQQTMFLLSILLQLH